MISVAVHDGFSYVQDRLYFFERELGPVGSKIAALPIVVADSLLECIRPLCQAVESVAFTISSCFAFLILLPQCHGDSTRRALRMVLLNLTDVVRNLALTVIKVASVPLFALAQLGLVLARSDKAVKIEDQFQYPKGDLARTMKHDEKEIYRSVQSYVRNKHLDEKDNPTLLGRCIVIPSVIGDILYQVVKPIFSMLGILDVAFDFLASVLLQSKQKLIVAFQGLNRVLNAAAELVATVAVLPLTLIGQICAAFMEPTRVKPSSTELHKLHIGDVRLSGAGVQKLIQPPFEKKMWVPFASQVQVQPQQI